MNKCVVIFSYKNVDNLLSLLQNILMYTPPDYDIMVFIDGEKNCSLENVQTKYLDIIKAFQDRVLFEIRSLNFGLKKNIVTGLDYIAKHYDYFLVLEDDIRVTDNTFKFLEFGIRNFVSDTQVVCCIGVSNSMGIGADVAYKLPLASSWGWMTTSGLWLRFRGQYPNLLPSEFRVSLRNDMVQGLKNIRRLQQNEKHGRVSSWYIYWQEFLIRNAHLCIYPNEPVAVMVDRVGTHASKIGNLLFPINAQINSAALAVHLSPIIPSEKQITKMKRNKFYRNQRLRSLLGTIRRKVTK